jgi:hypothetical protein
MSTPLRFNIFEWKVAMWPVPINPITGDEFVIGETIVVHLEVKIKQPGGT